MKKNSELNPWQHHAAQSVCRVGEAAGLAAICIGAAWVCRRLFPPQLKAAEDEPRFDQQKIQERAGDKNGDIIITTEKLSDVVGLESVKIELRERVIEPFSCPDLFRRFRLKSGGGVLMYGPPGNGKTFLARAVAGELNAKFFPVNAAEIKSMWHGGTEKRIQGLFDEAKQHPKAVIFFDEVEALLARRGNRESNAVNQFLAVSDGLFQAKNCLLLLAATNRPWMLDEAVIRPGRFGTHVYVGPPDSRAREVILTLNLNGVPAAEDVNLSEIAGRTENYSGADLAELSDLAKRAAKNRQVETGRNEVVTQADLAEALGKIRPSVSPAQIKQYEAWLKNRQRLSKVDDDED